MADQENVSTPEIAAQEAIGQVESGQVSQDTPQDYFSYKHEDGKEEKFQSRDELSKAWKDSYLRRKDYSQKTEALARERDKFKAETEMQLKTLNENKAKYDKWNELLKSRPDIYKQLQGAASRPPDAATTFERAKTYSDDKMEELKKEFNEMKEWKKSQELEKKRDQIYSELKTQYNDFNVDEVEQMLTSLSDETDLKPLMETLYYASKGKKSPEETQQKIMSNLKKKENVGLLPEKGARSTAPAKFNSVQDAADAALKDLTGMTP